MGNEGELIPEFRLGCVGGIYSAQIDKLKIPGQDIAFNFEFLVSVYCIIFGEQ